ncbi:glycosyltransferase family 4 protein [Flavisolibacter ginsenosidimutans]|uniref:Glycosyltransferase family 4 protein n=1 Tax=Flavisolibacter ginsenosidimutans TaxID=661481 RepID=A0A5B8UJT5_9BACT|nr:glycosyltransferase family 1 protein [Flavisolibacter ginsenosidimutans]QEC56957.1 glycosyltransferase family 4 protein [Flavisolibacter ginsenosidimutans]
MVIAVNTRFLLPGKLEGFGYFTKEVLQPLTAKHPEHQFHFFFDRPFDKSYLFSSNVQGHVLSPPARHPLLWKYWFDVKVPQLLKKVKADVFLSPDGQCSLTTKVPQVLVVHDLGFLHHPESYQTSHLRYYKHYTPKFINKAKRVITVSEFSKQDIVQQYKVSEEKISVVHNGVKDIFAPIYFDEQTAVKEKHTGGLEYFLYAGAIQPRKNLINLLKAFSVFKRRLQSSMKLVLAGRLAWKNDEFLSLLKTYKYKDDVVLTGYLEEGELAKLMASAYAFVYPSLFEGFGLPVMEAMKCGVPVLTSKASSMEEISEGTAMVFDPQNVDEIADALMRIYKDEVGRKLLIEKGKIVAEKYSWEKTAEGVWEELLKAVSNR